MRPPSGAWSWLKRRLFSSVAPYTRTGIVTNPKEIAPFQIVFTNQASFDVGTPATAAARRKAALTDQRQLYAGQQPN